MKTFRTPWWYNQVALPAVIAAATITQLWNKKVRDGVEGRKNPPPVPHLQEKRIWFHASSLGEYEQTVPLIESWRMRHPDWSIITTVFSPSAFNVLRGKNHGADYLAYLPFDTKSEVEKFIADIAPSAFVVMRYDLWHNVVRTLHGKNIPVILVSASLAKHIHTLGRALLQPVYKACTAIAAATKEDEERLRNFTGNSVPVSTLGNTKYDRVFSRAQMRPVIDPIILENINRVADGRLTVVLGSTYDPEEKNLQAYIQEFSEKIFLIIAPHVPSATHVERLKHNFKFPLLSAWDGDEADGLIIDSVGLLFDLYRIADITYVGGGFTGSVHNVLEPAAFGIPVLFGPDCERSHEAQELLAHGAVTVSSLAELPKKILNLAKNDDERKKIGDTILSHLGLHRGATERIIMLLEEYILSADVR